MDYLDYLPHTPYAELPAAVQEQISAVDYQAMQRLAITAEQAADLGLPTNLQSAYQRQILDPRFKGIVASVTAEPNPVKQPRSSAWWVAAAGWLLLVVAASALLLREPNTKIVYQEVAGPSPEPIVLIDTITETVTDYQTKVVTQVDTVFIPQVIPPELVYVRDTIYVPTKVSPPVQLVKSKAAAKERRLLDLLVETD